MAGWFWILENISRHFVNHAHGLAAMLRKKPKAFALGFGLKHFNVRALTAHFFFACTFAATFRRRAFSRMNPVASSWL